MAVRIGFDMDGVLADFSSAFRNVELRLFGPSSSIAAEPPEIEAQQEEQAPAATAAGAADIPTPREMRRRRDAIWQDIHNTRDFWMTLRPLDPIAVGRLHSLMLRHGWEVFFITQRPPTVGMTVQRQSQKWLVAQGFDLPSVLVISGSRGAAANALRLNYHVDDSPHNCLDVSADSRARPILIVPGGDAGVENTARRLRIEVARSIGDGLDLLEHVAGRGRPESLTLMDRLSRIVGLK
jgi:hypothetical protein